MNPSTLQLFNLSTLAWAALAAVAATDAHAATTATSEGTAIVTRAADAPELIRWFDGTWDERGAPQGKLLTDNGGWWGERVWTGVSYTYEIAPTSPADRIGDQKDTFGNRLIDGSLAGDWHTPVGRVDGKPIVAVFDFKRPCVFREVDFISPMTTNALASAAFSADGTNWTGAVSVAATGAVTRLFLDKTGEGRFLKISYGTKSGRATYLNEIFAWGEAEVSEKYLENLLPPQCAWAFPQSIAGAPGSHYGEAKFDEMAKASATGVEILEVKGDPDRINRPLLGKTPESFALRMARNETEARYFAVVNASRETNTVSIAVEGLGEGVSAELLVGGVMRVTPPKRRLSAQEIFDLKIEGHEPPEQEGVRFAPLPFFQVSNKPAASLAGRHLANPAQVLDFPDAVPLRPGEAVVLMLRFRTDSAKPGARQGALVAGKNKLPLAVDVVDLTLSDPSVWIYSWGHSTPQTPFETKSRMENDAQALLDIGVSCYHDLPTPRSKAEYIFRHATNTPWFMRRITPRKLFHEVYGGRRSNGLTDKDREIIRTDVTNTAARAKALGVPLDHLILDTPDEPGNGRAKVTCEMAAVAKEVCPEVLVFANPSCWTGHGFSDADSMIAAFAPEYNQYIDVSVPYRSHLEDARKREELFTKPRRINAQYAHPPRRAGRSISWSSFRYGLDGFAYWAYYSPTGNPWDIRTWKMYGYEALMVLPLENGVAVTPSYEELREAWEDWRLLTALKETGKTEVLDALLKEFADSFDRPGMEAERPYKCDFRKLRDKALAAFGGE
jgi:hypothetical protein